MLLTVAGECNYSARGTDTGIGSVSVLRMFFSSKIITNVNYVLDPSGVYFASPEGDVCQNNRIANTFFLFFLIDVIFTETDAFQCLLSHCLLGGLISPSIRTCFSDF